MAAITQDVIIDFQVDYSELNTAFEQLAKAGKIDPAAFQTINKAISSTNTETKGLVKTFTDVKTSASQMGQSVSKAISGAIVDSTKKASLGVNDLTGSLKKLGFTADQIEGFMEGVKEELQAGGLSMADFVKKLNSSQAPVKSLKSEFLELKETLGRMKLEGKDTGVEFEALRARAGKLKDAIGDTNDEIKNAGSDTRGLDNVVGSVSALAGGFAAVQGAAALFGDESEDLQKALLKVNAAMALATGLQQIATAVQKEGALTKLADTIATGGQTAAIRLYTFVMGGATVATKLFRAALIATGIGAIIVGIGLLIENFDKLKSAIGFATKEQEDFAKGMEEANDAAAESAKTAIEAVNGVKEAFEQAKAGVISKEEALKTYNDTLGDSFGRTNDLKEAEKLLAGKADAYIEMTFQKAKANALFAKSAQLSADLLNVAAKDQTGFWDKATAAALNFFGQTGSAFDGAVKAQVKGVKDATKSLEEEIKLFKDAGAKALTDSNNAAKKGGVKTPEQIAAEAQAKKDREKQIADAKAQAAKLLTIQKEARLNELNDELAALQIRLLNAEKNSQSEISVQKKIIAKKAEIELQGEKLTENQKKLIKAQSLDDQLNLQKEFNQKATEETLQAQIDANSAELEGLNVSNEERLRLTIENIETTSQIEINAAEGNAEKIRLIEAKKQADIRTVKIAAIDKERADQVAANASTVEIIRNALEKVANDTKQSANIRKAAVQGLERDQLTAVQREIDDNERKNKEKLISDKEYQDKKKELEDKQADISAKARQREVEIDTEAKEKKIQNLKEISDQSIQIAGQIADFFGQLSQLQTEQEQNRIEGQKKELQALIDAGAITEKDAKIRSKQLEIEEKQAKQRAAEREKKQAIFQAVINTAAGIAKAIPNIFLMAFAAAAGAAQIALISSRPVPKFNRGKKDKYEGPAEVGDIGAEIVERDGRMFLYTKPSQIYLGANDKVYNATETKNILHNTSIRKVENKETRQDFDVEKLAKAFPKSKGTTININKEFIEEAVDNGFSKKRIFDNRYTFK